MGVKSKFSSEYKRAFRSKYPCFTKMYEQNLDYRLQRRSVEHFHHVEPFLWDTESSENDSDQSNCAELSKPLKANSLPPHIYKHEKYNKAYHEHLKKLTEKFESNLKLSNHVNGERNRTATKEQDDGKKQAAPIDSPASTDTGTEEQKTHDNNHDNERQEKEQNQQDMEKPSDQEEIRQKSKARNHAKKKIGQKRHIKSASRYIPKPRPFSAPLGRPLKKDQDQEEDDKAPFAPYGYKDRALRIGKKKTYNVRASADIYPSALLAQKRRKALISKQEELEKSTAYRERQKRALYNEFNERVRRETSQWDTEYRRNFIDYPKEVYERSLSARPSSHHHHDEKLLAVTW